MAQKIIFRFILAALVVFFAFGSFDVAKTAQAQEFDRKQEDTYYVAVKSFQDGFYDLALTMFDRFLKSYAESNKRFEALVYIGQCYFYQEKYLRALEQFEMLLKMNGSGVVRDKILFWLGEVYAKGHDYRQAADFYRALIDRHKDSMYYLSAYKSLAQAYLSDSKFSEAQAAYRQILAEFKEPSVAQEASFGIAETMYRLRDFAGLKIHLADYIASYPASSFLARAQFYIAEAHFYLGEYDQAASFYEQCQRSADDDLQTMAAIGLGWSRLKMNRFEEAREIFDAFGDGPDQAPGVILGKAVLESGLQDYETSLGLFETVIAQDTKQEYAPLSYFGKAEALYHLDRFADAIVAYRTSLDKLRIFLGGQNEARELRDKIYYGLAWAYLKTGDYRSAQESFQKVVSQSTDKIIKLSALCQLGDAYQDAGDYKNALETYQKFLQDYPDSLYADYIQYQMGLTWLKMDNAESGIVALRRLLKEHPQSQLQDDANYFLGVTYFQKGDFAAASEQLGLFVKDFTDSTYRPQALFLLGESLVNLGQFKEALSVFGIILKEYGEQESWRQKTEYEIAAAYIQSGHEDEGFKRMADFITRYPDAPLTPQIIFWLGEAYKRRADFVPARKYFERLIRHYPDETLGVDAYLENGLTYFEEGAWEAALRHFEQVERRGDQTQASRAAVLVGDIYLKRDRPDQALEAYRRASLKPTVWRKVAYAKSARLQRENKNLAEAASLFAQALDEEGPEKNAGLQFEIAEVLQESGARDDAIEAYTKVYYLYPEEKELCVKALLRISQLYEDGDDVPALKTILEKIASLDVPEAKYAAEKLSALEKDR